MTEGRDGDALASLGDALLYNIPDAIVLADLEGVIRFWNGGAERIFGFSQEEAVGRSLDIIIPERLRQRHWDGYHCMMKTGQSRHAAHDVLSVPALTKSGQTLSIQFTVAAVNNREGVRTGIVALLRDVTATFEEMRRLRAAK
jgi:PAS domain S-box-containing protein